jgi:predicted DsbA family dithiol-disulfide isomerase
LNIAEQPGRNTIAIDVVSDVVCPWCFIGKRNLQTALQRLAVDQPQIKPAVRWLPFFLNPETSLQGEPYRPFLEKKFGGAAQVDAAWERITAAGKLAGIEFAFDKIKLRANTLNAHRLIHRFQQHGDAERLVERLFEANFLRGEHIGDVEVLAAIAEECGDDRAAVRSYLDSQEGKAEVVSLAVQAQESGIGGVPFFIFNQRLGLSGAQPPEVFIDAIRQAQLQT